MIGATILAAGPSSRLGTPKQTILYEGKTLLQHAVEAAESAGCLPVVIVLGAHANIILNHFHSPSATIVHNHDWQDGMGTSIAVGISALLQAASTIDAAIVMVCDQPFADATLLHKLIEQQKLTGKGIAASTYANTMGVPALFDKKYFEILQQLKGDEGAKKIMLLHRDDVALVLFDKGTVDIDTVHDVEKFRKHES